jgi:hypothetical protein
VTFGLVLIAALTFGQEPGEVERTERIRLEASFLQAYVDSTVRFGAKDASNRFSPENDLGFSRWSLGGRGAVNIKLWGFYGLGVDYLSLAADTGPRFSSRVVRVGSTEVAGGTLSQGRTELQQASFNLRLWIEDTPTLRAEAYLGVTWASYRVLVRPVSGRATTVETDAVFAPMLGVAVGWNFLPVLGAYFDSLVNYFAWDRFGSIANVTRAGLRLQVAPGLELVAGVLNVSGQVYDVEDRFRRRTSGHHYRSSTWDTIGPELGMSWTY